MKEIDLESDEWKETIKGKSPEEIAQIVGSYYEEQYEREKLWLGKFIGIVVFTLILLLILLTLYRLITRFMP